MGFFFEKRKKVTIDDGFTPFGSAFGNNNWFLKSSREKLNVIKFNYIFLRIFSWCILLPIILVCGSVYFSSAENVEISLNHNIIHVDKYSIIYGLLVFSLLALSVTMLVRYKLYSSIQRREAEIAANESD